MKTETTVVIAGKDERVTIEHGRCYIATHVTSQLSGHGITPEKAVEAMLRNIANPDPAVRKGVR